uniref:Uncharacterized protein n=1 Tax=Arundo donax TaxID=35708 RepID=A0A0A9AKG1_ARUDO
MVQSPSAIPVFWE